MTRREIRTESRWAVNENFVRKIGGRRDAVLHTRR